MTKMLVISDKIRTIQKEWERDRLPGHIDIFSWAENTPRLSDYEVVVLDVDVNKPQNLGGVFVEKRGEIRKLLYSGGVVICLTEKTVLTNEKIPCWGGFNQERLETNYDWLEDSEIKSLGLMDNVGSGSNITVESKSSLLKGFFKGVKSYHKTIGGQARYNKEKKIIEIRFGESWHKIDVFAINSVTREPIACEIDIGIGSLIFLPQTSFFDRGLRNGELFSTIDDLYNFGREAYERHQGEEIPQRPPWIAKYHSTEEKNLEEKIGVKLEDVKKLENELKEFQEIDVLLYGTDEPLVNAVRRVFEWWGCSVEKMEKSYTVDLKIKHSESGLNFALEVTGITDKLAKASKKFSQVFDYMTKSERDEKIVIVVNTYRDIDPAIRQKENFTRDAIDMAKRNKICLITTFDLFKLWKDSLEGKYSKQILKTVFDCDGEFRYKGEE